NGDSSAGPEGSRSAVFSRSSRTTRVRIHPPRNVVVVRSVGNEERAGDWTDRRTTHQPSVRRLPHGLVESAEGRARDPHHLRQPVCAQDPASRRISGRASECASALHTDLLVVAEPSGVVVCQNRTRSDLSRRVYLDRGAGPSDSDVHPAVQQRPEANQVAVQGSDAPHSRRLTFNCYSPLVSVTIDDVRHIATLARLGLSDDRAQALVAELNTILQHMDVLQKVDTSGLPEV